MNQQSPPSLASNSLVEVVGEVRFDAPAEAAINLLPGILHGKFGPFDHQGRTFPPGIPAEFLSSDPSFAFRPHVALVKDPYIIQVGPRVVSVACRAPYTGWKDFSSFLREVFEVVCNQSFVKGFDWISLKYVDVIFSGGKPPTLEGLNVDFVLGGVRIVEQPSTLRVEHVEDQTTTVVQISLPVQAQQHDEPLVDGVLVEVDTIHKEDFVDFAGQYKAVLEELHARNKRQYLSLLTPLTLERLEYADR